MSAIAIFQLLCPHKYSRLNFLLGAIIRQRHRNGSSSTGGGDRGGGLWLLCISEHCALLLGDSLFNSLFVYTIARSRRRRRLRRVHSVVRCRSLKTKLADNVCLEQQWGLAKTRLKFCNWPEFYSLICVCVNKINTRRSLYLLNELGARSTMTKLLNNNSLSNLPFCLFAPSITHTFLRLVCLHCLFQECKNISNTSASLITHARTLLPRLERDLICKNFPLNF